MAIATQELISQIDSMTVLELNSLVKALEEHYGVSAAAAAVAAAPQPPQPRPRSRPSSRSSSPASARRRSTSSRPFAR